MAIGLLILVALCIPGIRFAGKEPFRPDYIARDSTTAINGIFVVLIFFRHFAEYVTLSGPLDQAFQVVNRSTGQLIVTTFLFYSGYGVMESIRKKGTAYTRQIPFRRAGRVWLHFVLAVLLYLAMRLALGKSVTVGKVLLSLICWESLGNSNWYILVVVATYLFTCAAFLIFRRRLWLGAALTTVLCLAFLLVLMQFKPDHWYNTIFCYPLGIWYSILKPTIEGWVQKRTLYYVLLLAGSIIATGGFAGAFVFLAKQDSVWLYLPLAMCFVLTIVFLSMKVRISNPVLRFLGRHAFSIYILQRLPMVILAELFSLQQQTYLFFGVSLAITIGMALVFDFCMKWLDRLIFDRKPAIPSSPKHLHHG